jgi:23S rRNA pseudouridine2605 synthase
VRRDPEFPVRIGTDRIEVDGQAVTGEAKVYLVFNKPRGVVTSASDEKGRATVYEYLPEGTPWVGPVGRLDKASEGLLLLTNDSEWAARVTDPRTHLDKVYHVQMAAAPDQSLPRQLTDGVRSANGEILRVKRVTPVREGKKNSWLEIVLDEGKNRQIRRIFEALGIEVLRLVRVGIGPFSLGDLEKGVARNLTAAEKKALDSAMGNSIARPRATASRRAR